MLSRSGQRMGRGFWPRRKRETDRVGMWRYVHSPDQRDPSSNEVRVGHGNSRPRQPKRKIRTQ